MDNRNESIINKIKGLLALANDHKDDEESQTAFLIAQKLMIKYDISFSEIDEQSNDRDIQEGQVTAYKTLFWWERQLADIIASNFRVTWYYNSKVFNYDSKKKRAIIFMGYKSDVELAREMYVLAYDVLNFYVGRHVDDFYEQGLYRRTRSVTVDLKNSYIRGFLNGLNEKFEKQMQKIEQEFGLIALLPEEVKKAYDEKFEGKKGLNYRIPPVREIEAYQKGFLDGNRVDYTKSTLDEWTFD